MSDSNSSTNEAFRLQKVCIKYRMKSAMEELGLKSFPLVEVSIIAMKGPPFTRKTEFATLIASSLGCPLLSLEHILDELQPPSSLEPEDQAFRIICTMAHYHLSKGVSKNVVIDSPLSSAWHLHQLTKVASSISLMQARVVIVECKPMNVYLWQMKLEKHVTRHPAWAHKWYKPKNWEDVKKAIEVSDDYDERSVDGHKLVSKLVVDPLSDHPIDRVTTDLYRFNMKPRLTPGLVEAVKYMITRDKWDSSNVVVYHQWKQSQYLSSLPTLDVKQDSDGECAKSLKKRLYCNGGHNIIPSFMVVEGLEYEANCMACQKQVMRSGDAYNCKNCSLALHKECAESFDINKSRQRSPFPMAIFFSAYQFPENVACTLCREDKGFSDKCASCLFETHLKCRLMPTVINHVDTEEHFLTIVLLPTMDCEYYRCVACGVYDKSNIYLCKICGVAYHYKCLTLPRRVNHEHGGHHHHLSLRFSSKEAEDYICDECLEERDPGLWFYSCEECPFEVHPDCALHQHNI